MTQYNAQSNIREIKGVGDKTAALFAGIGVETVGDLLSYYPRDYDAYLPPVTVQELVPGEVQAVSLLVQANGSTVHAGGYRITNFRAADATGQIRLTYYNMPYLVRSLRAGSVHIFRGKVRQYKNGALQMEQAQIYTPAEYDELQSSLQPRYPLTRDLRNKQIISVITRALEHYQDPEDYLTEETRRRYALMDSSEAARAIHFPQNREMLAAARNRKVFDEFYAFLLAVRMDKAQNHEIPNENPMVPVAETHRLIEELPYSLTEGQLRAFTDIESDLASPHVMNRLLQGDVGSGKTIVAFLALLMCACNGRQGTLMAPTEVLAAQHMDSLQALIHQYHLPLHPVLLTGSTHGRERKAIYASIADGTADVIIGTHALIQDPVEYHRLGLVITDEQHRFGVRQREALAGKGQAVPVLVMSATPIPRTLSIILYGDLSVSLLTELPGGRLPIKNLAISADQRGRILQFLVSHIRRGEQAYIICPAVEESEYMEDLENVTDYTQRLTGMLPQDITIGSLHGRMKPQDKTRVMTAFANHDIDILVSTTVVEVGINVPNATIMIIENAERFGLSQLHQLRGRVGRGSLQSYCVFLYAEHLQDKPPRLKVLEHSNDGFEIAEQDLQMRGPGDLFGVRQSGAMGFRLADIYADADILRKASEAVNEAILSGCAAMPPGVKSVDFRSI